MGDLEQLAQAVMDGHDDTDVDHLRGMVSTANRIAKAANITPPITGVANAGGPFRAPSDPRGVLLEQLGARWPCSDGRARSTAEMIGHVLGVISALPAGATTPGGSSSTPWRSLPVLTAKAATSDRSSFQSAIPSFDGQGMTVSLLANGDRTGTPNPTKGKETQRCEILLAGWEDLTGTQFFRWDFTLASGFPVGTSGWQTIAQLKNDDDGSPPLEVMVGDGEVYLQWHDAGGDETGREPLGPATTGVRHAVVLGVPLSTKGGKVTGWFDGVQSFSADHGPTMYPGQGIYGKVGLYRSNHIGAAAALTHHGVARGSSFTAVT